MNSKYAGTCARCSQPFSVGTLINYFGRGRGVEHVDCENVTKINEDDAAGFERGTLANDRHMARNGVSVVRFASGAVMTQNRRGRCEDAPCCGCCS